MISFYTDNFSHTITILQYKKSHLLVNDIGDHKQKEITHFFHIATIASEDDIRSPSDTGDTTVKPAFILGLGPFPTQTNANIDIGSRNCESKGSICQDLWMGTVEYARPVSGLRGLATRVCCACGDCLVREPKEPNHRESAEIGL